MTHPQVQHPRSFLPDEDRNALIRINDRLLNWLADHVLASRLMFNLAFILPLLTIPMTTDIKLILAVISSNWIQWWALPALARQQLQADIKRDAKAKADHRALLHIARQVDKLVAEKEGR